MEFLLEITTEELPSSHALTALEQLKEKFQGEFRAANIAVNSLVTLGTCRRLIVLGDVAVGQEEGEQEITGPPKSAGYMPDGSFSQAAKGFARAQGVSPEDLQVIRTSRGEYLGIRKIKKGKSSREVIQAAAPQILASLAFPKTMRWGTSAFKFSRPIKKILSVFGAEHLPLEFQGIASSDTTAGHKIFSPHSQKVTSFAGYKEFLEKNSVFVDPEQRRAMILAEAGEKLAPLKAGLYPDERLLERLVWSVECPRAILGSFPEKYLGLPLEVLATAMREGQKLFSVVKEKKQLPFFVGVADTPDDAKSLIRTGNERVLKARLEDAKFFWDQDTKLPLSKRASGLKNVVFQEKLGSYEDKVQRVKKLVSYLGGKVGAEKIKKELMEAASLCKTDLLTEMVKEFPSLQGKMGGLYATVEKRSAVVAQAIYEHYQPQSLEEGSPSSLAGALLSLADKMDSVVGVLGIGVQVSGSSDPFGLRRNALGICKIILEKKLSLSFPGFLDKSITLVGERLAKSRKEVKEDCLDFFGGRLRYIFEKEGYRYDLVGAAFGAGIDNMLHAYLRVKALDSLKASPQFEPFILMAKRVNNILRDLALSKVNPDFFLEKEERELFSTFSIIRENVRPMIAKGDFLHAQSMIFKVQPNLNAFFERVLVMAEDKKTRQNRLALLQAIRKLLLQVADYSQVIVEGERAVKAG